MHNIQAIGKAKNKRMGCQMLSQSEYKPSHLFLRRNLPTQPNGDSGNSCSSDSFSSSSSAAENKHALVLKNGPTNHESTQMDQEEDACSLVEDEREEAAKLPVVRNMGWDFRASNAKSSPSTHINSGHTRSSNDVHPRFNNQINNKKEEQVKTEKVSPNISITALSDKQKKQLETLKSKTMFNLKKGQKLAGVPSKPPQIKSLKQTAPKQPSQAVHRKKKSLLYQNSKLNTQKSNALLGSSQKVQPSFLAKGQGLKNMAMHTSSLFNSSIEKITSGTPLRINNFASNFSGQANNAIGANNMSTNTTQQLAQLVTAIQPSDKSTFQYVPRYFKPNVGPPSKDQKSISSLSKSQKVDTTHNEIQSFERLECQFNDFASNADRTLIANAKGQCGDSRQIKMTPISKHNNSNASNTTNAGLATQSTLKNGSTKKKASEEKGFSTQKTATSGKSTDRLVQPAPHVNKNQ